MKTSSPISNDARGQVLANPSLRLWVILARAHDAVRGRIEADILRHGLTPAEFGVLEALHHKGPLLLGDLQRKVLVSSGGITYLVDRLAKRGLVERLACPGDRRARNAGLTPAGRELIEQIFPEHQAAVAEAVGGLSQQEQAEAIDLLRKLGKAAEQPG
jgi:MarR family 2-MHQ and catechol resistance regulon transcriptional repressor